MKLGKLRQLTKHLPDDTEVVAFDGTETWELHDNFDTYPPVLNHSTLILFNMGQRVDQEFELDIREPFDRGN